MNFCRAVLLLATVLYSHCTLAEIPCPPMPGATTDVSHDVKSHVNAAVGSLGRIKAGELSVQTEVVARNLVKDFPNADRLMIAQMMAATYCAIIRDNTAIAEKDKPALWEKFQSKTYSFLLGNEPPKTTEKKVGPVGLQAPQSRKRDLQETAPGRAPQAAASPAAETGPIIWEDSGQFVVVTGGGRSAQIDSILLQGTSTRAVNFKSAYAVSGRTGHKQDFVANVQSVGAYYPVTAVDIPPEAPVWIELLFKPALSITEFQDQWGSLSVTMKYQDGTTYTRDFDEGYIRAKLMRMVPNAFGPRMTPRATEK
jgi:hypothetical protein